MGVYLLYPFIKSVFDGDGGIRRAAIIMVILVAVTTAVAARIVPTFLLLPGHWQTAFQGLSGWLSRIDPFTNISMILFFIIGGLVRRLGDEWEKQGGHWIRGGSSPT